MMLFPNVKYVEHSLGDGLYSEIIRDEPISEDDVEKSKKMSELVEQDIPIEKYKMPIEEALSMFKSWLGR